jgi:predicted negative regulator of RcsB-dependent stress response
MAWPRRWPISFLTWKTTMAVYDLEEQEKLSDIKAGWEKYGKRVTTVARAAAVGSVGWQAWQWYQAKQSGEAAALFAVVQKAAEEKNAVKAKEAAGRIIENYSRSAYADLAALVSAKVQLEAGDLKNAQAPLAWAAEHGRDPFLRDLARLRLATVLLDEKAYDQALARLAAAPAAELTARYADLRGDVLAAQGKLEEAGAAYQAALDALGPAGGGAADRHGPMRNAVRTKLESLGVAK